MISETNNTNEFFPIWKKYRPVILRLMIDATDGTDQTYKMSKHEFTDVNRKKTTTYSFKMQVHQGKVSYGRKGNLLASDLFEVLKQSAKANELMESSVFSFELNPQFQLSVGASAPESTEEAD